MSFKLSKTLREDAVDAFHIIKIEKMKRTSAEDTLK
jgi:hypothetical protein